MPRLVGDPVSVVSETLRDAVCDRAQNRCEYCQLPNRGQSGRFPVDHIVPRTEGGPTHLDNLALACPTCNGHKWMHTTGIDPATGTDQTLYHPRKDVWETHFAWLENEQLQGLDPMGRATIIRLQINNPANVEVRRLMAKLGLFPELSNASPSPQPDGD